MSLAMFPLFAISMLTYNEEDTTQFLYVFINKKVDIDKVAYNKNVFMMSSLSIFCIYWTWGWTYYFQKSPIHGLKYSTKQLFDASTMAFQIIIKPPLELSKGGYLNVANNGEAFHS